MTVVDANFLVDLEDGVAGAISTLERLTKAKATLGIPAAAWVEYVAGVNEGRRAEAERSLATAARFLPFGLAESREAVRLHGGLIARGRPLNWHDLQVAATALALGEPLVSNDQAFRRVPGLEVTTF